MNFWATMTVALYVTVLLFYPRTCIAAGQESRKTINERLLVVHSPHTGESPPERLAELSAYDGIVEHLTDKGYRIVDKASAERFSLQVSTTHDIDSSLNKAAAFGLKFYAEYSVLYRCSIITKDNDSGKGALVRVIAQIVDTTSSQVVTAKSADASSAGMTVDEALEKAGRLAGKKLAALLSVALERNYRESVTAGRVFTIVIDNPSGDGNLLPLLSRLEGNKFVSAARETESGGGKTTLEVAYLGKRDQLDRDLLNSAGELGWKLRKIRSEGNRSTWRIE
jgi:hypothetical protein